MLAAVDSLSHSCWDLNGSLHDEWFSVETWTFWMSLCESLSLNLSLCFGRSPPKPLWWGKVDPPLCGHYWWKPRISTWLPLTLGAGRSSSSWGAGGSASPLNLRGQCLGCRQGEPPPADTGGGTARLSCSALGQDPVGWRGGFTMLKAIERGRLQSLIF